MLLAAYLLPTAPPAAGNRKVPATGACFPFTKKMYVTVNGKILPCERIGHQFSLGHITPEEIVLDIQGIADKYNGYYSRMEKRCGTCKNKELVYNACLI